MKTVSWRAALGGAAIVVAAGAAPLPTAKVIYTFGGGTDGSGPVGGVTAGREGVLYGTTFNGGANYLGTVYKLTPNWRQAAWTKSTLYSFRPVNDGRSPNTTLVTDAQGALYGSTELDDACGQGTVFKLTPPVSPQGAWTEQMLYDFCQVGAFASPTGLTIDRHGVLYGTGVQANAHGLAPGLVFQLASPGPGQSAWTETTIYDFPDFTVGLAPEGGVIADRQGALYGTAYQGGVIGGSFGTVFKLAPPVAGQTTWTATALYRFAGGSDGASPVGGLVADRAGALYGTTSTGGVACGATETCGTVFRLTPPAGGQGSWTHTVLYSFKGGSDGGLPEATLSLDWRGTLYGSTKAGGDSSCEGFDSSYYPGCGTIFKLEPPAPGGTAWTETVLHNFTAGGDGASPGPTLVKGWGGRLFGTATEGGAGCPNNYYAPPGCGTVFELPLRNRSFGPLATRASEAGQ